MSDAPSILSNAAIRGAYGQAKALQADPVASPAAPEGQQTFAEMVKSAAEDAVKTVRAADATAQAGLAGKVDTQQVVEATLALESTVKTTVAVRDRLVEAYQEIMRMPI
ncbi:flagellar hook-basal body complex protein FliE [Acidimangrovimonas pyrenivorans]|uniref:Flagellar hook-basal body complex protein FliE n=1 Tax=Acidimangrovimonas pyrenivorans TaxID=2030798 RepID=A0ABV7AM80_9RHOB